MTEQEAQLLARVFVYAIFAHKIIGAPFRYKEHTKHEALTYDKEYALYLTCFAVMYSWIGFVFTMAGIGVLTSKFDFIFFINLNNYLSFIQGYVGLFYTAFLGAVMWKALP